MNAIELSEFIRCNFPAGKKSLSLRKSIYGVGINDSTYEVQPSDGEVSLLCPCYKSWKSIMARCYSKGYQATRPTYVGASVHESWISFSSFRDWWLDNYVDGWHLDKDLLVFGNNVYGPDTCKYVPVRINCFAMKGRMRGSKTAIGTHFHEKLGKYHAHCRNPFTGMLDGIGFFETESDARGAWMKKKIEFANQLRCEMDLIDERIFHNTIKIIEAAQ